MLVTNDRIYRNNNLIWGTRQLTAREWQLIKLLADGLKNKEIAVQMGRTENVIKNYLRVIYDKTGCWNRTELAVWYLKILETGRDTREKYNASIGSATVPEASAKSAAAGK